MDIRIAVTLACVLIAALGVPLILRKVPPNALYGFRTPRTLSSPDIWYPANAFSGAAMLVAAVIITAATWLSPPDFPEWAPVAWLVAGLLGVLIASMLFVRRLG